MYNSPVSTTTVTNFDIANFIKLEEPLLSLKLVDIFNTVWFPDQIYSFPATLIKSKHLRFQIY